MTWKEIKLEIFKETMKAGGVQKPLEEQKRLRAICEGCDKFGVVKPFPGIETSGCTICKCPVETKVMFEMHVFDGMKDNVCPHPEGNKWINNK